MISLGSPLAHSPSSGTRSDGPQLALIADKLCSAEAAVEAVKPGNRVFIGTACATPVSLVEAFERRHPAPPDVELFYFLTSGLAKVWIAAPPTTVIAASSSEPTCASWCEMAAPNMYPSR